MTNSQTRVRELISQAQATYADGQGNVEKAVALLEQARALIPHHETTLILLGSYRGDLGEWKRSIELANELLTRNPKYDRAYSLLGHAYRALGDTSLECRSFLKAAELRPTPARYVLAGHAAYRLGDEELAERCFRDALTLDPNDDEAMVNLAIQLRVSDTQEAERLLRRALSLEPTSAIAQRELGFVLAYTGRNREAQDVLRECIAQKDTAWAHVYLAFALWDVGDMEASEAEFAVANALRPDLEVFEFLARAYERRGDQENADLIRTRWGRDASSAEDLDDPD